ncbi:hypothetical protein GOP47_0021054 [Adiantum capillus-veneris]|uniref:Uncharacterized protein n=1 Tax=Adiantum capillus-veneris TaxID=13818 RepID=A0A9D4UAC6_ADICA|nr:hypothetical protein GOP47_0021054 [Adiantum capillus-veneris]
MNVVLQTLHSRGVSIAQIRQAVSSLPLPPETVSALKVAHALGCELYIVSDANTFFIEVKLAHHGLDALFTQIHSNPAWIDAAGCLHYDDFHGHALPPHTCPLCPPNMCKGIILKSIQEAAAESATLQVIYAGDGAGDLCPTLWLNEGDHVLPRQGYPLSKLLFQHQVKARVHPWTTLADTLLDCVVSSDYDMQHNLNHVSSSLVLSAAAPAGKWRVLKGSAVTDACVRSMICCSESEKNPMSQWRRALVNCQSCSPTGSFRIHIATAKVFSSLKEIAIYSDSDDWHGIFLFPSLRVFFESVGDCSVQ